MNARSPILGGVLSASNEGFPIPLLQQPKQAPTLHLLAVQHVELGLFERAIRGMQARPGDRATPYGRLMKRVLSTVAMTEERAANGAPPQDSRISLGAYGKASLSKKAAFASTLPRKAKGTATITVTFTPNSSDYATAKTVAKVKIKK